MVENFMVLIVGVEQVLASGTRSSTEDVMYWYLYPF
jgi:hypothetical protein